MREPIIGGICVECKTEFGRLAGYTTKGGVCKFCRPKAAEKGKVFQVGKLHVMNCVPTNREEANAHANALAASGNYPVGTSDCFNVGISGGCGMDCFVYLEGDCEEPQEMLPGMNAEELARHRDIYGEEE